MNLNLDLFLGGTGYSEFRLKWPLTDSIIPEIADDYNATFENLSKRTFTDEDGNLRVAYENEARMNGAHAELDPAQLFATFTCSSSTPDPLATMLCSFCDGSTWALKTPVREVRPIASGTHQLEEGLIDEDEFSVFIGNTSLIYFFCYSNQLTGSIPRVDSNVLLDYFHCGTNQLTGDIPRLSNNTVLAKFYCNSNQLTGWLGGSVSSTITIFNASNNLLPQQTIDDLLQAFVTAGASSGTLILGGSGNEAPSSAGVANKTILEGRGWTVTVNS